jgi:hypothetical protein
VSDIFFTDASEAPVPRNEVRIRVLDVSPRRDGVRVDVHMELTPFQQRPNIEVAIANGDGQQVAALSVIEAIDPKMDFTMHLREGKPAGDYSLSALVFYSDVEASAPANGGEQSAAEILNKARQIVDQRKVAFKID